MAGDVCDRSTTTMPNATACEHGVRPPVVCPKCDPETYERARPQVERWLKKQAEQGRVVKSQ